LVAFAMLATGVLPAISRSAPQAPIPSMAMETRRAATALVVVSATTLPELAGASRASMEPAASTRPPSSKVGITVSKQLDFDKIIAFGGF